ncbi:MAG: hypothetical protein KTR18_04955 [Acidiferrobacterales bacterium]|nr:hypothetical protein [Acidiferrobacterales bacterium]
MDVLDDAGDRVVCHASTDPLEQLVIGARFDLAILDISIRGDRLAGHKMCLTIKVLSSETRVAMLTSFDDQLNRTLATAVLFLGQRFVLYHVVALALVLGGIAISELRKRPTTPIS